MNNYTSKKKREKHGLSDSPEYDAWIAMKARCDNPKTKHYHRYGGRGITYSKEWKSFKVFISDVEMRPSSKHSLDRIDNNGNYTKENCRWTTRDVQVSNRENSIYLTYKNETKTILEWAKETGIHRDTLYSRIFRFNYSVEDALENKLRSRKGKKRDKCPLSKISKKDILVAYKRHLEGETISKISQDYPISAGGLSKAFHYEGLETPRQKLLKSLKK